MLYYQLDDELKKEYEDVHAKEPQRFASLEKNLEGHLESIFSEQDDDEWMERFRVLSLTRRPVGGWFFISMIESL